MKTQTAKQIRHASRGTLADSQDAREFYLDQAIKNAETIHRNRRLRNRRRVCFCKRCGAPS